MASVGRPRSDASHAAILKATYELLQENGLAHLTLDKVASRAGVSRSTLYRWWPSRGAIAMEAVLDRIAVEAPLDISGASTLDTFARLLRSVTRAMRGATGRIVAGILAECQRDPETLRLFQEGFLIPRRAKAIQLLQRGMEEGALRPNLDPNTILDLTFGSLYYRLILNIPLEEAWTEGIVDIMIHGIAAKGE
ncbi:MAG: TetR/AcrR family transcriptional regulator [Azospirillaceae bacterium]|nr:TetR/AcrR family transcriptional regulator [Azospirillaceae bacterium]